MQFLYSKWRPDEISAEERRQELRQLFNYLLLQTNGDVDQALEYMKWLDQRHGIFGEGSSLQKFIDDLKKDGRIESDRSDGDALHLTKKGERAIREDALDAVFSSLRSGLQGNHPVPHEGRGVERLSETRSWKYGDDAANIDFSGSVSNALKRNGIDNFSLQEDDLEVYETEHLTSCATVLLLDISHSMVLYGEDRITPAKQVALALSELIMRKYPKDELRVALFGDDAQEISVEDLPYASVGPYHTNTKAALALAQSLLLRSKSANKQIFMITDGKPSVIWDKGRLYYNSMGLDPKIVAQTINEAHKCRRHKIPITTFMVTKDPYLVKFVQQLTEANHGRAYYSSLDKLGEYVLEDYVRNRRTRYGR